MRRRTLVLGTVVLVGAALVLFCCTGGGQRDAAHPTSAGTPAAHDDAVTPPAGLTTAGGSPSARAPVAALSDGSSAPHGALAPPADDTPDGAAPRPTGPGARIADAVRTSDPRDLKLLARIERELHEDPPPEVHALIALRKQGAGRDELARAIQKLPELPLRVMAFRWLDEFAPAVDAG